MNRPPCHPAVGRLRFLLLLGFCLLPASLYAWGEEGHRIVALLSQERLADEAKAQVIEQTGPEGLVSVAAWADAIRDENTETWHYVNGPRRTHGTTPGDIARQRSALWLRSNDFAPSWRRPRAGKKSGPARSSFWSISWAISASRCIAPTIGTAAVTRWR